MPAAKRSRVCGADDPGGDLWGRPPAKAVECPGCGLRAEPFDGRFCWLCVHTGQMAFVLNGRPVTKQDARGTPAGPKGGH